LTFLLLPVGVAAVKRGAVEHTPQPVVVVVVTVQARALQGVADLLNLHLPLRAAQITQYKLAQVVRAHPIILRVQMV
jgi:hypothetical protein